MWILLVAAVFAAAFVSCCVLLVLTTNTTTTAAAAPATATAGGNAGLSDLSQVPAGRDYTLSQNGISIVFAKRLAGAVWTLRCNGYDFVGVTEGNGGNMQSAISYDVPPGTSNEEENPTEAGNVTDYGGKTSSRWVAAAMSANEMYTRCQMAYWIPPGTPVQSSESKAKARGSGVLSDTFLSKRVTIGYKNFPNVIRYAIQFECATPHWFAQVEVLTGYMPSDFKQIYTVENGGVAKRFSGSKYSKSPPDAAVPIIVAKSSDVALGVYAESAPPNATYKQSPWYSADTVTHGGHRPGDLKPVRFTKWNVVWHTGSQLSRSQTIASSFAFGVCVVIGSVKDCASIIARLGG